MTDLKQSIQEQLTELDAEIKATAERAKQLADDLANFLQPQWYQAREKLDAARATEDTGTAGNP